MASSDTKLSAEDLAAEAIANMRRTWKAPDAEGVVEHAA